MTFGGGASLPPFHGLIEPSSHGVATARRSLLRLRQTFFAPQRRPAVGGTVTLRLELWIQAENLSDGLLVGGFSPPN